MAAITGNQCGFVPPEGGKPCARRVKNGELRCWQHKDQRSSGEPKQPRTMEEIERQRELIKEFNDIAAPTNVQLGNPTNLRIAIIREFTPISRDALDAVEKAFEGSPTDLSIPNQAAKSLYEKGIDWFVEALLGAGLSKNRVSKMKVDGANRMKADGEKKHQDYRHEVILIDGGTMNEVVVDPHIALFAPVSNKDRDKSVEDILPSGETPFGDIPWIGTVHDYVAGDHLWWDDFDLDRGGR